MPLRTTGAAALLGLAGAAAAWGRLPGSARAVLWAEDGRDFIGSVQVEGFWKPIFTPYAGYQQFAPRIVADLVVALFPPAAYAVAVTALSCLVAGMVCALVYLLAGQLVPWAPARIGIALLPVLSGSAVAEVLGNAANLHSVVMCLGPWLLLHRPSSRARGVVLALIALAATLTEIQLILFLPFALFRLRDRHRLWGAGGVLAAGLIGVASYLAAPREPYTHTGFSLASNAIGYLSNAVLGTVLSSRAAVGAAMAFHAWLPVAACALLVVCLALVLWRGSAAQRVLVVALAYGSIAVWTIGFNLNSAAAENDYAAMSSAAWLSIDHVLRYGIVPGVLAFDILLLAAAVLWTQRPAGVRAVGWASVAVCLIVALVQFTPQDVRRSGFPAWDPSASAGVCASHPSAATVAVPEAPSGWVARIACSRLR